MGKQVFDDYKYMLQDTHTLYIGAKYSMREIIESEEIPIKFRLITERYLYTEEDKDTSLESHFYYLPPLGQGDSAHSTDIFYKVCKQLKTKLRISIIEEKKSLFGKTKKQYTTRMVPMEELAKMSPEEKEKRGVIIQEVAVNKFAMMTL